MQCSLKSPRRSLNTQSLLKTTKISFRTTAVAGGYAQISVVVTGLSKPQFKGAGGLLSKLHAVPGVGWSAHKNIGGHRKEIVGKVSAEKLDGVSAQLKDLVSSVFEVTVPLL